MIFGIKIEGHRIGLHNISCWLGAIFFLIYKNTNISDYNGKERLAYAITPISLLNRCIYIRSR